jgi:hypothetical protein
MVISGNFALILHIMTNIKVLITTNLWLALHHRDLNIFIIRPDSSDFYFEVTVR